VAHYAYVPSLVPRDRLTGANGKLQVSYSAAETAGPGIAGLLIQAISPPLAILATALSFLTSAALLGSLRGAEERVRGAYASTRFRTAVAEGVRFLLGHPLLRPIIVVSAASSLFVYGIRAIYVLFATREVGLDAAALGAVVAIGGLAAVPGGVLAGRVAGRLGLGRTIWLGWFLEGSALLLIPFASRSNAILLLIAAQAIGGLANSVSNVNQWSLRQVVTPDELQGRVTASHRFLVYGAYPLGAVLGGLLATQFGLRPALLICAIGAVLAPCWLLATPVRLQRAMPRGPAANLTPGTSRA
jgi:predicted MFS family arabinose efflux permease